MMNIKLATDNRKAVAARLAEITSAEARYTRVPRCAYEVGAYIIEKDGTITTSEDADLQPLKILADEGLIEPFEMPTEEPTAEEEAISLTVEIPFDKVNVGNLTKLLDAKGDLIKKALGRCGDGLHKIHRSPLPDEQGSQAGDGNTEGSGEREIRLPMLPSQARIHRYRVQKGSQDPA